MKFSELKGWSTPRGNVTKLAIDGVTVWEKSKTVGSLAVGSSVFLNENGTRTEFYVAHQGLPSSAYDSSCNGTWLLRKYPPFRYKWGESEDSYADSDIHAYLNGTYLNTFDSGIKSLIKQAKIPSAKNNFVEYEDDYGDISTENRPYLSSVSAKIFLLSSAEVGRFVDGIGQMSEGSLLDLFNGTGNAYLIAYVGYNPARWSLRSLREDYWYHESISPYGVGTYDSLSDSVYVRPAMILPSSAHIDENFNVLA